MFFTYLILAVGAFTLIIATVLIVVAYGGAVYDAVVGAVRGETDHDCW